MVDYYTGVHLLIQILALSLAACGLRPLPWSLPVPVPLLGRPGLWSWVGWVVVRLRLDGWTQRRSFASWPWAQNKHCSGVRAGAALPAFAAWPSPPCVPGCGQSARPEHCQRRGCCPEALLHHSVRAQMCHLNGSGNCENHVFESDAIRKLKKKQYCQNSEQMRKQIKYWMSNGWQGRVTYRVRTGNSKISKWLGKLSKKHKQSRAM